MEPAQEPERPLLADQHAHADILGKARVHGRRKRQAALDAVAARGDTQRAFRRNMHHVRLGLLDHAADLAVRPDGQTYFPVTGTRHRAKADRRDHQHLVSAPQQTVADTFHRGKNERRAYLKAIRSGYRKANQTRHPPVFIVGA